MGASALTAAVSPLAFGLIADAAGLVTAMIACVVPVAAGWVIMVFVGRQLRRGPR